MNQKTILFIGAGNMGQAIINGILKSAVITKNDISIYEPHEATRNQVVSKYGVKALTELNESVANFSSIFLAVKPQVFKGFGSNSNILQNIHKDQILVSIMAGVNSSSLSKVFPSVNKIVRVMPNTPSLIGEGMSVLSFSDSFVDEDIKFVRSIFESIGLVEELEEKQLDAVTGLSGSGPAFVLAFIEAMTQGGVLCGLSKSVAEKLAVQTVVGTSLMAKNSGKSVEELRHMVTSPGGTTIHGVEALEEYGLRNSVIKAVKAAYSRSVELSK